MGRVDIKKKTIYILSFLYLLLPNLIFIIGYTRPLISIPLGLALIYCLIISLKDLPNSILKYDSKKKVLLVCLFILFVWVLISGVGGLVWQNRWDHKFRNALFNDMVLRTWPVSSGSEKVSYYFGFWLIPSLLGKVFGLDFGYYFQFFYALIGVSLAFLLMFEYLKNIKVWYVLIFILYSGLDALSYILLRTSVRGLMKLVYHGEHLELTLHFFNSSSNTTLLFWLYNQIIPFWIGFLLLLLQKSNKLLGLIYACMLLFCPFPSFTMLPVVIYLFLRNYGDLNIKNSDEVKVFIKSSISFQNIVSVILAILVALFFLGNNACGKTEILPINYKTISHFFIYFIVEYGLYLILIYPQRKKQKDHILLILCIMTILTSFYILGDSHDFAWRTCIPLAFYIMLCVIEYLSSKEKEKVRTIFLILVLLVGMLTPLSEMIRTARGEYHVLRGEDIAKSDTLQSIFDYENNEYRDNFISDGTGIFFEYIAKK